MSFQKDFPDFVAIEDHIRRAHAERSLAIAQYIAGAIFAITRGLRKLASTNHLSAIADRRAVEADAFVKRWVSPR